MLFIALVTHLKNIHTYIHGRRRWAKRVKWIFFSFSYFFFYFVSPSSAVIWYLVYVVPKKLFNLITYEFFSFCMESIYLAMPYIYIHAHISSTNEINLERSKVNEKGECWYKSKHYEFEIFFLSFSYFAVFMVKNGSEWLNLCRNYVWFWSE